MPLALYALTAGAFGIGTTEFVIMGLLLAGRRRSRRLDRRGRPADLRLCARRRRRRAAADRWPPRRLPRKTVLLALMVDLHARQRSPARWRRTTDC